MRRLFQVALGFVFGDAGVVSMKLHHGFLASGWRLNLRDQALEDEEEEEKHHIRV